MQLKGNAAIVTGGASGLGAETARYLAKGGAKVAVVDRNAELARDRRQGNRRCRHHLQRRRRAAKA